MGFIFSSREAASVGHSLSNCQVLLGVATDTTAIVEQETVQAEVVLSRTHLCCKRRAHFQKRLSLPEAVIFLELRIEELLKFPARRPPHPSSRVDREPQAAPEQPLVLEL